jgi:hypothetical protein
MKSLLLLATCSLYLLLPENVLSQTLPVWYKDVNAFPDSSSVIPVRIKNDKNSNVLVLSAYIKGSGASAKRKIFVYKNDSTGFPLWNLKYDNGGTGQPTGFDMASDTGGYIYIVGGLMSTPSTKPLLMKVSPSGTVIWQRDSTISFNNGYYKKLVLRNNQIYLAGTSGLAKFDFNGNEIWSDTAIATAMTVDLSGNVIYSDSTAGTNNIFRCDSSGVINFSDSAIFARRIAYDAAGNFYLLADTPQYSLTRYDKNGSFAWNYQLFPAVAAVADSGMEVLVDNSNNVIVTGLSDTMYKFDPAGNLLWTKGMNGLDHDYLSATITSGNFLAIAGSVPGGNGFDTYVAWFDLKGDLVWSGHYSGNDSLTEYAQDMSIDNSGIYALENNNNYTTFFKFENPAATTPVDYAKICVDSVWYGPGIFNYYNVRVYNGNINALQFPSVRCVDQFGDTIGNPNNNVPFFQHPGNTYQTYYDTIKNPFVVNFYNYTYIICEYNCDSLHIISLCPTVGIDEYMGNPLIVFPNPAENELMIKNINPGEISQVEIFNAIGVCIYREDRLSGNSRRIDISGFAKGMYVIRITGNHSLRQGKFVKQ